MINKDQILVVPVNYTSYIDNGLTGATFISTKNSYSLFDSLGVYEPRYKIDDNICFTKISVVLIFKYNDKYLVKELYDLTKRPCLEIGENSYVYPYAGNNNALLNQINHVLQHNLKIEPKTVDIKFIGYIRDYTNESMKSVLGNIYYVHTPYPITMPDHSVSFQYKWYSISELVNRYTKATSWSKQIIDALLENTIEI